MGAAVIGLVLGETGKNKNRKEGWSDRQSKTIKGDSGLPDSKQGKLGTQ